MTVVVLLFAAYFLRHYLVLIGFAAVLAYLFQPIYRRLRAHEQRSGVDLDAVGRGRDRGDPAGGILTMAGVQIAQMVSSVRAWLDKTDLTEVGTGFSTRSTNSWAGAVRPRRTADDGPGARLGVQRRRGIRQSLRWTRPVTRPAARPTFTMAIIFLYVFLALLTNAQKVVDVQRPQSAGAGGV